MSTRPKAPARPRGAAATTSPSSNQAVAGRANAPVPRLPHEHDESHDSQEAHPEQDAQGNQAYEDVRSGKQDTSRSPVTDATYERLKKPG